MEKTRSEYHKEYQRRKWQEDPQGLSAAKRTLRAKRADPTIPQEDIDRFGKYLGHVVRIRKLLAEIPAEVRTALMV